MATQEREISPLVNYEDDEREGRKAFLTGKDSSCCPWPSDKGGSIRRLAWMRGYFAEKYFEKHQRQRWF